MISAYDMLRSEYDVGIGYGDDLAQAKAVALDAIRAVDGVFADPAPDVLVWELGESSKTSISAGGPSLPGAMCCASATLC